MTESPDPAHYPLLQSWCFALQFSGAFALFAIGYGAAVLAGLVSDGATEAEAIVAIIGGLAILPFVASTLLHGALRLGSGGLDHLRLGYFSSTGHLELEEIAGFEVVRRVAARGKRRRYLLVETRAGAKLEIPLHLFRGQTAFVEELERRTGLRAAGER